jgi:hypothetical protein
MKSFTHVISQKHLDEVFIQTNITMLKKKVHWKTYFSLKDTKNNIRGFVSTFILHVYQNARWNQRKFDPKIIQNLLKVNAFSFLNWTPHKVISPITSTKSSYFSHQIWLLKTTLIAQTNFHKMKWIVALLMVNNILHHEQTYAKKITQIPIGITHLYFVSFFSVSNVSI